MDGRLKFWVYPGTVTRMDGVCRYLGSYNSFYSPEGRAPLSMPKHLLHTELYFLPKDSLHQRIPRGEQGHDQFFFRSFVLHVFQNQLAHVTHLLKHYSFQTEDPICGRVYQSGARTKTLDHRLLASVRNCHLIIRVLQARPTHRAAEWSSLHCTPKSRRQEGILFPEPQRSPRSLFTLSAPSAALREETPTWTASLESLTCQTLERTAGTEEEHRFGVCVQTRLTLADCGHTTRLF